MADKIIWICGGQRGWAVRMDGHLLESNLEAETALKRANKMAAFIEEGSRSVEIRVMQLDGTWAATARKSTPKKIRLWDFGKLQTA
jgi:hypothetical protein